MNGIAFSVPIRSSEQVSSQTTKISFNAEEMAEPQPGQFLMINCHGSNDFHLKRPFSISDYDRGIATILVKRVGEGSAILQKRAPGERIELLGPLGNGFHVREGKHVLLVGAGIGSAPLPLLARRVKKAGGKVTVLLGARNKHEIFNFKELQPFAEDILLYTEDGSLGKLGLITEGWEQGARNADYACACGPNPLLRLLHDKALATATPLEVSLEQRMACGYGACFGCVHLIERDGSTRYERVCAEGPVFRSSQVCWPSKEFAQS